MKAILTSLLALGVASVASAQTCQADFKYSVSGQTVSFVDQSTPGGSYSYMWNFGDGGSSTQQNPTHTYAQPGQYSVCLFIYDSLNCQSSFCDSISVGNTTQCKALFKSTHQQGTTYQFHDQSTAFGNIIGWFWDFGDGNTSSQQHPAHTYQSGNYEVCLTIYTDDSCSSTDCDSIYMWIGPCIDSSVIDTTAICTTIYDPVCGCDSVTYYNSCVAYYHHGVTTWTQGACGISCQAYFTASYLQANVVKFKDQSSSSGTVVSWFWDFGDGTTSTQQNPTHTFANNGAYVVCLTITTSDSCISTYCKTIQIGSNLCEAKFTYTNLQGQVFKFQDHSIGNNIISWFWDFGDGGTSTQQHPAYTYTNPGLYLVCLTIVTSDSCTDTYCDSLWVGNSPCFDPSVIDTTKVCPTIYDPVCGCDGVTYSNSCEAYYYHGITQWTNGPCGGSSCKADFTFHATGQTVHFADKSTAGSPIIGWVWDFGDGNGSVSQNPVYTYTNPGTYVVCLTILTLDLCFSTWCDTITVHTTGFEELGALPGVTVSPNPAADHVMIMIEVLKPSGVVINAFDISGRNVETVFKGNLVQGINAINWDVSYLDEGVYFLRVAGDGADVTRKVIVLR